MKKIFVVFTILLGLLAGCSPAATPAPIPATKTLVSSTNTPIPATSAPTASVTATQPLANPVRRDNSTGLIAFLSDRDGKPAIYVMNADGSNQRRLAGGKPGDTCLRPVWSPDGQRVAYMVVPNGLSGDRHGPLEIWSVGLDGAEPVELSAGVTDTLLAYPWIDPTWSPDGTRLAVAALHPVAGTSDKHSVVTILRSDGSGVEQAFPLDWIAGGVEWASNGEQILIQDMSSDESVRAHNVHVLSLSNGEIREVYRDIFSAAWSPDGTEIVVVPAQSGQVLIVKLDGTSRPVGPLPAGTTPELAVWSPDGTAITVFGKTKNGDEASLYLVTISTGQVRRITLVAEYLEGLEYSPDGKQLLVSTGHSGRSSYSNRWPKSTLLIYDLASATLTALTDGKGYDAAGTWAPSPTASTAPAASASGEIAFASDLDGDFEIWLMNADGNLPRQLTDNAAMDISPAWSPDGSRLAFISNRDGNDELYTMNADGSNVRRLTDTLDASESFPAWSPDGQFISFDSDRGGNWDVYIANSDGSNLRRLTDHPGEDWISSWSPDGQKIAFESKRDGNYEIYVVNIDGSHLQRLTQNTVQDGAPKWSPDGSKIAFFSRRDGNSEIYVMNADGSNLLRLTNQADEASFPTWSPNGVWLVFSSGNNQQSEIYLISADGSQLQPLTANGAQNWTPVWRPAP